MLVSVHGWDRVTLRVLCPALNWVSNNYFFRESKLGRDRGGHSNQTRKVSNYKRWSNRHFTFAATKQSSHNFNSSRFSHFKGEKEKNEKQFNFQVARSSWILNPSSVFQQKQSFRKWRCLHLKSWSKFLRHRWSKWDERDILKRRKFFRFQQLLKRAKVSDILFKIGFFFEKKWLFTFSDYTFSWPMSQRLKCIQYLMWRFCFLQQQVQNIGHK